MEKKQDIIYSLDVTDNRFDFSLSIDTAISSAEIELQTIHESIESVDDLVPDCDKLDYVLAASSGAICGVIDVFPVGKPGESPLTDISDQWVKDKVTAFAKLCGWDEKGSKPALKFLEEKFRIPYDQTGRGIANEIYQLTPSNHHFKSLGHNPTLLGLFFSILDQFTDQSHFVTEGQLLALQQADGRFELRGGNIPVKLVCGFVNWFGHLVSDVSGSSSSKGRGMGLPSPFLAWTNDLVVLKRTLRIPDSEFDRNLCELAFNTFKEGYDLRFTMAQAIPVFVNEVVVRLMYSVRRLIRYFRSTDKENRALGDMWDACEPFSNPTVKRMLTVAHGTFCLVDVGDAFVRGVVAGGGTFNPCEFVLRLNLVGVGRFSVSLYGETRRAVLINRAKNSAEFALREKTIVKDYMQGLLLLADMYDDASLVVFVDDFKRSGAYKLAFEKSVRLAQLRKVPDGKILKDKADIDTYFTGSA